MSEQGGGKRVSTEESGGTIGFFNLKSDERIEKRRGELSQLTDVSDGCGKDLSLNVFDRAERYTCSQGEPH